MCVSYKDKKYVYIHTCEVYLKANDNLFYLVAMATIFFRNIPFLTISSFQWLHNTT